MIIDLTHKLDVLKQQKAPLNDETVSQLQEEIELKNQHIETLKNQLQTQEIEHKKELSDSQQ